jgi:hypothetical protein
MPTLPRPIPYIPGAFQVAIKGQLGGLPVENTFHIQSFPPSVAPDAEAVATAVAGAWIPFALAVFHTAYSVPQLGVYDLGVHESVEVIITPTIPGGKLGSPAPAGTCALLTHHTAVRRKRGLTYLGGLPFNAMDTGTGQNLTDTAFGEINAAWVAFQTALETNTIWGTTSASIEVLSYVTGGIADIRMIPIISTGLANKLSSLRRRRARG